MLTKVCSSCTQYTQVKCRNHSNSVNVAMMTPITRESSSHHLQLSQGHQFRVFSAQEREEDEANYVWAEFKDLIVRTQSRVSSNCL